MENLKKQQKCTMYDVQCTTNSNDKLQQPTTRCPTKTFGHDKRCGFTLVELVITIAIVIILSVVSVPIYRGYTDKAKMSEAYALLGLILSAQKAYYSEYGNFLTSAHTCGDTNYNPKLGIDARGNKFFTCFRAEGDSRGKHYFDAWVYYPTELGGDGSSSFLAIAYNITKGSKFIEKPRQTWDSNWYTE
mgnify:CR=1 FL=1